MKRTITSVVSVGTDQWDAIWHVCDYATYFHSSEWAALWSGYTGGVIVADPRLVQFSDGKKALLPLSCRRLWPFRRCYLSSPAGTYGGWISGDDLDEEHGRLLSDYLLTQIGRIWLRANPYCPHQPDLVHHVDALDDTDVLNLSGGFDAITEIWNRGNSSVGRKVRKALREGVVIRTARTKEDWLAYYEVYRDSLRRWGKKASSRYDWKLFDSIHRMQSAYAKLWLAEYGSSVIAGALCLYSRNHAIYWHGASLEQYFNLRPVNLLMFEAIKDASARGAEWFDFNPSGGHEGVRAFKKSFGTCSLDCPVICSPADRLHRGIRRLFGTGGER